MHWDDFNTRVTIPVLDESISVCETECEAKNMKANKACVPDSPTLGIFNMLFCPWLLVFTMIFNNIFSGGIFPAAWMRANMFNIYKKTQEV